ncbi:hypothetical protein CU098_000836, partial [Rhizopus stolonifer]
MSNLQQLVKNKFAAAKESKDLVSFETTQTEKESSGIKFQLTLAPALAQKTGSSGNKSNPFIDPNPALIVKELDEHLILLNKFAVIPNHMLL